MKINDKLNRESLIQIRSYIYQLKKATLFLNEVERVRRLILKWKLNKSMLAEKIGMPKTTFSYTLMGKPHYRFSRLQFEKLTKVLTKISDDLKTLQ
jgi:hypothetical protein